MRLLRSFLLVVLALVALPAVAGAALSLGAPANAHWVLNGPMVPLLANDSASSTGGNTIAFAYIYQLDFQAGQDELAYTPTAATGDIVSSYNSLGGDLTLSSPGGATDAQWTAALRAVRYYNTSPAPVTGSRGIYSILKNADAVDISNGVTSALNVATTDAAPVIDPKTGSASYVRDAAGVAVAPGLTLTDGDDAGWEGTAQVAITGGFDAGDTLSFSNSNATTYGAIGAGYDSATGVLTLTSTDWSSRAQWANALKAVAFSTSSTDTTTRTVAFSAGDGNQTSATVSRDVAVASPDPVLTASSGTAAWTQGDNTAATPAAVDPGLTLADADSTGLASVTVSISGGYHTGDILHFDFGSMTDGNGSYSGGVLTVSGSSATLAQWQALLRSVTYTTGAAPPNTATRTISFTVTDPDGHTSTTVTRGVTLTATDQTPRVTASGGSASWTQADNTAATPVAVDPGLTVADADNTTLASATVAITGGLHTDQDALTFNNTSSVTFGNIAVSGSYDADAGVLTLTSNGATATVAQWRAALRAVTYNNTAVTPSGATRTFTFVISDGDQTSAGVTRGLTLTATGQTPVVTVAGTPLAYTEGDGAVALGDGATVADADSTALPGATVAITSGFQSGEDVLAFTPGADTADIAAAFDPATGVLTLTSAGGASPAQWQAALRAVTYEDASEDPSDATRTVTFQVSDGAQTSAAATRDIAVTPVNDAPVVATTASRLTLVAGAAPVAADPTVTVADIDSAHLGTATAAITAGYDRTTDRLEYDQPAGSPLDATFDASTGTLTLIGSGTPAQVQAALRGVTIATAATAAAPSERTIALSVHDGDGGAASVTRAVAVAPAPVVDVQEQKPAAPVVTPPAATPPASTPPAVTPPAIAPHGTKVPGVLSVPLPATARTALKPTARGQVTVSCVVKSTHAATCAADLFATDPAKAGAARAVKGKLLGRGSARVAAHHAGAVRITVTLNPAGRSLAARYPKGFAAELRVIARYAGAKGTSRVTRQVRITA